MRVVFEIEVPDGAVDKSTEGELIRAVKELTVLKLYTEHRITARDVAEMLGMSQIQLLDPLGGNGVELPAELKGDDQVLAILDRWQKRPTGKRIV